VTYHIPDQPKPGADLSAADLVARFDRCLSRPTAHDDSTRLNREGRYTLWNGQSWDGRKWVPKDGDNRIVPWAGASDVRLPMVDVFIREDAAILLTALNRARLTVAGIETTDIAWANRATTFLRWMLANQITEMNREANLLANYLLEDGRAVLGVFWDRQTRSDYETLDLETIINAGAGANAMLDEADMLLKATGEDPMPPDRREELTSVSTLAAAILDPTREDEAATILAAQAKDIVAQNFTAQLGEYADEIIAAYSLTPAAARRIVRDMRDHGKAKIAIPTVSRNRPTLVALKPDYDVWYDNNAVDLDAQTVVFRVEWLTASALSARVETHGWDQAWVDHVLESGKGESALIGRLSANRTRMELLGLDDDDLDELYPVIHAYQQCANDDNVIELRCRVLSRSCVEQKATGVPEFAIDQLLNYAHGELPFVHFRAEYLSRRLDDSRGYGEVGYTWQAAIKTEIDMQRDRSMLATNPPLHHPRGRPPSEWGPGARVPASPREYFYAELPPLDQGTNQVIEHLIYWSNLWFGRLVKDGDPTISAAMRQTMVDNWLHAWGLAITQVFQLCQQYMPDEFYYRVVGSAKGRALHATRDEIRGKFDLQLGWNILDMNPEYLEKKLATIQQVVAALDINGIVDRDELLAATLEMIDPNLGERILQPAESAAQKEIEDEQATFAKMWSGLEQDIKPGQAYQLRIRVLQDAIAGTMEDGKPKNPAAMQRYQADERFKEIVDKRMQQLQFQLQQRDNAVIGRLGA